MFILKIRELFAHFKSYLLKFRRRSLLAKIRAFLRIYSVLYRHLWPSCTGVRLAITMLQYYICVGIVLTVVLVLGLGLGFGIILYFVIGT